MHVAKHFDFALLRHHFCKIFGCPYYRCEKAAWLRPFSILIKTCQIGSVIPVDDPVNVKHGNYIYYVVLSERQGLWKVREEPRDDTFKGEGGLSLSWMNSCSYDNGFFREISTNMAIKLCLQRNWQLSFK